MRPAPQAPPDCAAGREVAYFRSMRLACFLCDGPGPKVDFIVDRVSPDNGCWGLCKLCGIAVCTGHGRRHENPDEYQCALCVGPRMRRGGPDGNDPTGPTTPEPTPDAFVDAYSDLKAELLLRVRVALDEYFEERELEGDSSRRMDSAARAVAAAAFEQASGIAAFRETLRKVSAALAENA